MRTSVHELYEGKHVVWIRRDPHKYHLAKLDKVELAALSKTLCGEEVMMALFHTTSTTRDIKNGKHLCEKCFA